MILITRGDITQIIVTASEKESLNPTVYSISFTNDLTKSGVTVSPAIDTSPFPNRYNKFQVDTALFADQDNGFYTYRITDQAGNLLEIGKMKLVGEKLVPVQYQDTPTEYKTYGE
ncbi:hypothetical protein FHW36_10678 [Chitinophaga polysaccharea]|uniref:Uncharacterized protein n=1 Tax=Chitinophaga polysaccharea TaxID=1293035 RepID=A0A561PL58_9BACT|nr:hypothetical protein [Chitinophaga polysaccharea]TWF38855.1 hypothetical protein FHW36_10678 [Chitinophaga polysaccharea]